MNEINPGYPSPLQTPLYWKDEQSGKLEEAVMAFFKPYAQGNFATAAEMPNQQLELVRGYLIYYIKAPCWKNNTYADSSEFVELNRLEEMARNIASREDIKVFVNECLKIGLDPF